ncbi:MAG: 16S rRNA (cytidine(1402)-2'-O)-methyltransferase [Oscillospiraceae bacterium]|nr:16S rRNA (cytidine(1402)-2'-O)-methyltransferase [Oscillospiraceae bacterium]
MEMNQGSLYVVGTPIGNLSDISERAIHTLKSVDFIAAEDTRISGLLLSKLDIKNKLTSYFEHNAKFKEEKIVQRIINGESCAVITDAGMPCISDPGESLVKHCREAGIPIYVVPGPCAVTSALALSGISAKRFSFEGFLSTSPKERREHLDSLKESRYTLIFYEAPHKLKKTLSDLLTFFGDRRVSLCREMTKMYEEVLTGRISEMLTLYGDEPGTKSPKGEYVIVVEGLPPPAKSPRVNKYEKYSKIK